MLKKIGILTSGGDCAGLNAAIRAVVTHATQHYGYEVWGIAEGTEGLLSDPLRVKLLKPEDVPATLGRQGGTILGTTNRGNPFAVPDAKGGARDMSDAIIAGYKKLGLGALIAIGGDGSLSIQNRLAQQGGIKLIGIPKTIDNDLGLTENSIGFDTAVTIATEALDRLQPTAASHARIMVLEVMGRDAGHIALEAGIAGGADVILIPEIDYTLEAIADHIEKIRKAGRNFALVIVSESLRTMGGKDIKKIFADGQKRYGGIGDYIGDELARLTGAETRVTVLGHVQRGGTPSALDRILGYAFGVAAVDLIAAEQSGRMVAWQNRKVVDVAIEDAIKHYQAVDPKGVLVKTARGLGISFGDKGE